MCEVRVVVRAAPVAACSPKARLLERGSRELSRDERSFRYTRRQRQALVAGESWSGERHALVGDTRQDALRLPSCLWSAAGDGFSCE